MNCPYCSHELSAESPYCPNCGGKLIEGRTSVPNASKLSPRQVHDKEENAGDVIWRGRFSKWAMLGAWLVATILSLASIIIAAVAKLPSGGWIAVLAGNVLVWLILIGRYLYLRYSCYYELTPQRFTHQNGLLWRETDRIEVIDVDDVSFTQGPIERLLGVGTVRITSSDQSHPLLVLPGIDEVQAVAHRIDEARRQERQKRGLYIESV